MLIVPAIDIFGGKVVRLHKGDFSKSTDYGLDGVSFAKQWQDQGAELIHIVDLDGAREGVLKNYKVIEGIIKNTKVKIEVGGGIRNLDSIKKYIDSGADRVVLSTRLIEDEGFLLNPKLNDYLSKIVVSLDIKQMESSDLVTGATGGWDKNKDALVDIPSFLKNMQARSIKYINFSDIERDGTMQGPDLKKILLFLRLARKSVESRFVFTYAGGISSLEDLKGLSGLSDEGVDAVIVGRALYEKKFTLKEALEAVK